MSCFFWQKVVSELVFMEPIGKLEAASSEINEGYKIAQACRPISGLCPVLVALESLCLQVEANRLSEALLTKNSGAQDYF